MPNPYQSPVIWRADGADTRPLRHRGLCQTPGSDPAPNRQCRYWPGTGSADRRADPADGSRASRCGRRRPALSQRSLNGDVPRGTPGMSH
ncbi:hypothetical protein NCGM1900_0011 [Pseudomonas aeruginosa]|nr:hypothetical protein NCGM1900_0011 [Pseudomonas aeruginosa]BAP48016.1 hypothetical protein NCGM1984_0011 [Pseudomonas aeruginosa]